MKEYGANFVLDFPDRPLKVLQVTDTQTIDSNQCRYEGRLCKREMELWKPENKEKRMYRYLRAAIERTQPDLVVNTGDFVYGEFDDKGTSFFELVRLMEAFGRPWTVAYGNHEKDSALGAERMGAAFEGAKNCLFRAKNDVDGAPLEGDGTFSILLTRAGRPAAIFYIADTGSGTEDSPAGIFPNQVKWMERTATCFPGVPGFLFQHIPLYAFNLAAETYGISEDAFVPARLPENDWGDFGYIGEIVPRKYSIDADNALFDRLGKLGIRGVFAGHLHRNCACILYRGVRLTYGLKTGEYDSHIDGMMGGTLLTLSPDLPDGFRVEHVPVDFRGEEAESCK